MQNFTVLGLWSYIHSHPILKQNKTRKNQQIFKQIMSQLAKRSNLCLSSHCALLCSSWPCTRQCWRREQAGFKCFLSTHLLQWTTYRLPCCGTSTGKPQRTMWISTRTNQALTHTHACTEYRHLYKPFLSSVCVCVWLRHVIKSNPELQWHKEGRNYSFLHLIHIRFVWFSLE